MNVIWLNISRLWSCFSFILSIIKKAFCRRRQRRDSEPSNALPVNQSQSSNQETDWADWGNDEQFSIKIESSSPPPLGQPSGSNPESADADDLFKDMTPVFKKPKKIVLKTKRSDAVQPVSSSPNRLNFNMDFPPVQADLEAWEDTSGGWDGDEISEREMEWETENVKRENKQAERERRALEQQRKKEERDALRQAKKTQQQFGVKVNS